VSQTSHSPRLVRACLREPLDRPPVWLMRQAGRYLSEYMQIREKVPFLALCKNPELAAEVSIQPFRRFGMDGVIMFSDILIPVEAMGMTLEFTEKGPVLPEPIRSVEDINRLSIPDPIEKTGFVMEILKRLRQELSSHPDVGLIGFAGAPWTLASYMLEGGVSRNYTQIKKMMYDEPQELHRLLGMLADTVTQYLNAQIEAGAQVVQLFDSWGGIVSRQLYGEFIHPYHVRIIEGLNREKAPVILYVNGSRGLLDKMAETGADVVGVDWLTSLSDARKQTGNHVALQGNLDPNALYTKPEVLRSLVETMLAEGGSQGYICNLGHGILPTTPIENVQVMVDAVKQSGRNGINPVEELSVGAQRGIQ
jgi:uroporphyrinogen decarboxylase